MDSLEQRLVSTIRSDPRFARKVAQYARLDRYLVPIGGVVIEQEFRRMQSPQYQKAMREALQLLHELAAVLAKPGENTDDIANWLSYNAAPVAEKLGMVSTGTRPTDTGRPPLRPGSRARFVMAFAAMILFCLFPFLPSTASHFGTKPGYEWISLLMVALAAINVVIEGARLGIRTGVLVVLSTIAVGVSSYSTLSLRTAALSVVVSLVVLPLLAWFGKKLP